MAAEKHSSNKRSVATTAVHAGEAELFWQRSLVPPIAQTSTYVFESVQELLDYKQGSFPHAEYGRYANPTVRVAEEKIAALEQADDAILTASGMAAQALVFLTLLCKDAHVLVTNDLYPGTTALLETLFPRYGIHFTLVPTDDPDAVKAAIRKNTAAIFTEFPTNPHLRVPDLEALGQIAGQHRIPLIVDATLASPILCRPLEHGASLVIHSCTKYLAGHNDLLAGVVCGPQAMIDALREQNAVLGAILSPHDAYLLNRGIKTLPLRVAHCSDSAAQLAERLQSHPLVEAVYYPGIDGRDEKEKKDFLPSGCGGLLSFRPKGGQPAAIAVLDNLKLFAHAASLGGTESMAQITYLYTANPELETENGIEPDLIRLSVGLEDVEDLWADLSNALEPGNHK